MNLSGINSGSYFLQISGNGGIKTTPILKH
ncbi:MAG: hypothetical protein ACOVNZ_08730 [Crocinitomicaceae bacterium]